MQLPHSDLLTLEFYANLFLFLSSVVAVKMWSSRESASFNRQVFAQDVLHITRFFPLHSLVGNSIVS